MLLAAFLGALCRARLGLPHRPAAAGLAGRRARQRSRASAVATLLAVSVALEAPAADLRWTGAVNAQWSVGGNWEGGTAPGPTETALFDTGSNACQLDGDVQVAGITVDGYAGTIDCVSCAVDVDATFRLASGTFVATGGVLSVSGDFLHLGGSFQANAGTVRLDGSAAQLIDASPTRFHDLQINAPGQVVSVSSRLSVDGDLDVQAGTLTVAARPWWDPAYAHRRRIELSAGGAAVPAGYSVSLTFNHAEMFSGGESLDTGNDVRVASWDGSNWVELDRVLDGGSAWNLGSTTIWFKTVASIPADSTVDAYYVYYGNPAAGAPPADRSAVYLLWDDFEEHSVGEVPDGWTVSGPTTVTVQTDGSEKVMHCTTNNSESFVTADVSSCEGFVYEAEMRIMASDEHHGLLFRFVNPSNTAYCGVRWPTSTGETSLWKRLGGSWTGLSTWFVTHPRAGGTTGRSWRTA